MRPPSPEGSGRLGGIGQVLQFTAHVVKKKHATGGRVSGMDPARLRGPGGKVVWLVFGLQLARSRQAKHDTNNVNININIAVPFYVQ